jgi:hypothetical protein
MMMLVIQREKETFMNYKSSFPINKNCVKDPGREKIRLQFDIPHDNKETRKRVE